MVAVAAVPVRVVQGQGLVQGVGMAVEVVAVEEAEGEVVELAAVVVVVLASEVELALEVVVLAVLEDLMALEV